MSESGEQTGARKGRLGDAVREVKNRAADREDAVVELKEAVQARLELLAAELEPVFADVPAGNDSFDFAISSGLQPRLWIDAVAHVGMARDHRTFQFVRDTRVGRITIAESQAVAPIAEAVTTYIAERIVERERALASVSALGLPGPDRSPAAREPAEALAPVPPRSSGFRSVFVVLVLGILFGVGLAAAVYWEQLSSRLFVKF